MIFQISNILNVSLYLLVSGDTLPDICDEFFGIFET